eukprot:14980555-Ditylum_brightwellii.AAC.1
MEQAPYLEPTGTNTTVGPRSTNKKSTMTISAPSVEDIQAGFVFTHVNKITDQPTYATIDRLQQQLIQNAATVESTLGGGNNRLLGLIEFPPVYFLQTGVAFICPGNPGEVPTYPPMITDAQRAAIKQQHAIAFKNYITC